MNLQQLTHLVSFGEGLHLEFKLKVPKPQRMAKEIIAFANTKGGNLLLGIDDDGSIVGVKDASEEEYSLKKALEQFCNPMLSWRIERVPISRKRDVICVRVPQSLDRPHFLVDHENGANRTAYVRVRDMSVEASREAVRLMRFEKTTTDVKFEFGERELKLMRYLEQYGRITVSQFARLAHIPKRRASQTLVLLARADLLTLHADPKQDYFTANRVSNR